MPLAATKAGGQALAQASTGRAGYPRQAPSDCAAGPPRKALHRRCRRRQRKRADRARRAAGCPVRCAAAAVRSSLSRRPARDPRAWRAPNGRYRPRAWHRRAGQSASSRSPHPARPGFRLVLRPTPAWGLRRDCAQDPAYETPTDRGRPGQSSGRWAAAAPATAPGGPAQAGCASHDRASQRVQSTVSSPQQCRVRRRPPGAG